MGAERSQDRAQELAGVQAGLAALEDRLARVEAALRIPVRPVGPAHAEAGAASVATAVGGSVEPLRAVPLSGRLLLVLAGAFLLRAITESGQVPPGVGVGLGLLYAWLWVGAAHRAAVGGERLPAAFHGAAAALVAYPLLWEATARFGLLAPGSAALLLAATTFAGLLVAARNRLEALAWVFGGGAAGTGAALLAGEGGALPFAACFVALGVVALWLARTRGWLLIPWASALLADGAVVFLSTVAAAGRASLWLPAVLAIQLALPAAYLAAIGYGLLRRARPLTLFDVLQSCAVLAVGYQGAIVTAGAEGATLLGMAGLALGLGVYLLAFVGVAREHRGHFLYLTSLALVLVVLSSARLLDAPALPWTLLAVATAAAGSRTGRVTLGLHGVLYAVAAAYASGLLGLALTAWLGSAGSAWPRLQPVVWLALAATALCAGLPPPRDNPWWRGLAVLPGVLAAALLLFAGGGVVLSCAVGPVAGRPGCGADPALLAVLRTGVLATEVLLCALAARTQRLAAVAGLVYPLLALGLAKLLIEDLPRGRPSTLWLSLLLYGAVLILGPRVARGARAQRLARTAPAT